MSFPETSRPRMKRARLLIAGIAGAVVVAVVFVAGCESSPSSATEQREAHRETEIEEYVGHYRPPMVDMSDVMQAKMAHMFAIVEGMAVNKLPQVADNAADLRDLSERASWLVHDSVTYIALSDEFRDTADRLARSARQRDADAALAEYMSLTHSCLACHRYLRKERLEREMPGRVSWQRKVTK